MKERSKKFVVACALCTFVWFISYFFLVHFVAIPERIVERSYKQFLLESSAETKNKIIVSGGSNAVHGIDAGLMEDRLSRLTLNLADNGSYPLSHKIYNLWRYVTAGDVIVFSLEWAHYSQQGALPKNYVHSVLDRLGSNSFYYWSLPWWEKVKFVFGHVPWELAAGRILQLNGTWINQQLLENQKKVLGYVFNKILRNERGTSMRNGPEPVAKDGSNKLTCDRYLFKKDVAAGLDISESFVANLELLRSLELETGARVLFTWPVVVGRNNSGCYSAEHLQTIRRYAENIEKTIGHYGLEVVGDILDSRFPSSCFLNTYYHITHDCAIVRTERLIAELSGVLSDPVGNYSRAGQAQKFTGQAKRKATLLLGDEHRSTVER